LRRTTDGGRARARPPAGKTDLYLAHFLGAGGATEILKAIRQDARYQPSIFFRGGIANRSVFFDSKTGEPRTVADLYRSLSDRIEKSANAYRPLGAAVFARRPKWSGDRGHQRSSCRPGRPQPLRRASRRFQRDGAVAIKLLGGNSASAPTTGHSASNPTSIAALAAPIAITRVRLTPRSGCIKRAGSAPEH